MITKKTSAPFDLESAKTLFSEWRSQKTGRVPIPTKLWNMALSLSDDYSHSKICKELRLGYTCFKKKLNQRKSKISTPPAPFVQLELPEVSVDYNYQLEFCNKSNKSVYIHAKTIDSKQLISLITEYLGTEK